jgi:hypothetical protein
MLFLALATATALDPAAESYDEHRLLRGPNDTEDDGDRDLLTMGSSSQSFSFSAVSADGASEFCIDYKSKCLEIGWLETDADTSTDASGSGSVAVAASIQELFLQAFCDSFALAYSTVCAFTKVEGEIEVDASYENRKKKISLGLKVKAAATTFAKAATVAVAEAYTNVQSSSFTDVGVFCSNVGNLSPFCEGQASTDLTQIATADASSFGAASSLSTSSATAGAVAQVETAGSIYSYVNGLLVAYAKSWSFSEAEAAAVAFAASLTENWSVSFADVCFSQHGSICGSDPSRAICGMTPEEACAQASAYGTGYAEAISLACAKAVVDAYAKAQSIIFISANIDLSSSNAALAWTAVNADVKQFCNA